MAQKKAPSCENRGAYIVFSGLLLLQSYDGLIEHCLFIGQVAVHMIVPEIPMLVGHDVLEIGEHISG